MSTSSVVLLLPRQQQHRAIFLRCSVCSFFRAAACGSTSFHSKCLRSLPFSAPAPPCIAGCLPPQPSNAICPVFTFLLLRYPYHRLFCLTPLPPPRFCSPDPSRLIHAFPTIYGQVNRCQLQPAQHCRGRQTALLLQNCRRHRSFSIEDDVPGRRPRLAR